MRRGARGLRWAERGEASVEQVEGGDPSALHRDPPAGGASPGAGRRHVVCRGVRHEGSGSAIGDQGARLLGGAQGMSEGPRPERRGAVGSTRMKVPASEPSTASALPRGCRAGPGRPSPGGPPPLPGQVADGLDSVTMSGRPRMSTAAARMSGSSPTLPKISVLRQLIPVARGRIDAYVLRSTSCDRTPYPARSRHVMSPGEPPPTTSTGRSTPVLAFRRGSFNGHGQQR